jgi:hypothetical protein
MRRSFADDLVPGYRAEERLEAVVRFRRLWPRYEKPDDVNALVKQFPRVSVRQGYALDYFQIGGRQTGWIWPYARRAEKRFADQPPEALRGAPPDHLAMIRGRDDALDLEAESLYGFLEYEPSPLGLFEYAFFVKELWATKSEAVAADWLGLQPLFVKHRFDALLRAEARHLVRFTRPKTFDPSAQLEPQGGGRVTFLVFEGGPWKRIGYRSLVVDPRGWVRDQPGEIIASLKG